MRAASQGEERASAKVLGWREKDSENQDTREAGGQ